MNKNSLKKGLVTHAEIRIFREQHPVRVKVGEHALFAKGLGSLQAERRRGPLPSDSNKNFTYGMPTRYITAHVDHRRL